MPSEISPKDLKPLFFCFSKVFVFLKKMSEDISYGLSLFNLFSLEEVHAQGPTSRAPPDHGAGTFMLLSVWIPPRSLEESPFLPARNG